MDFINTIETKIKNKFHELTIYQRYAFITAFIIGIVAHGYVIFNRLSYHDNSACLFSLGGTYESGRWMLGIIYDLQMLSTKLYSVPVFNALLSILFIAIAAMLMIDIFDIKSKLLAVYMSAMMVAYPVVTGIFSYMFTSWEYLLGMLVSVLAARTLVKNISIKTFIVSAILLSVSLGFYQAFFAVTIVIYLIMLTLKVIDGNIQSVKDYAKTGVIYLLNLVAGLGFWAIIRKFSFFVKGIDAVDYKGMSDGYSLSMLPAKLLQAYQEFFGFRQEKINTLLYLRVFTAVIVIITIIQLLVLIIRAKTNVATKIASLVGVALLPIGMNVVYILSTSDEYLIDTLMMYGNIFVFLLPVVMIQIIDGIEFKESSLKKLCACVTSIQAIGLLVMLVGYIYLDNAAYMKADIVQQQAIAWYTELAANIKGCDGFSDDMEIVLVGIDNITDGTITKIDDGGQLDIIQVAKYPDYLTILSNGGSINFAKEHIGFGNDLVIVDDGTVAAKEEVQSMPTYPNDGSIQIIDGQVVVKLGE